MSHKIHNSHSVQKYIEHKCISLPVKAFVSILIYQRQKTIFKTCKHTKAIQRRCILTLQMWHSMKRWIFSSSQRRKLQWHFRLTNCSQEFAGSTENCWELTWRSLAAPWLGFQTNRDMFKTETSWDTPWMPNGQQLITLKTSSQWWKVTKYSISKHDEFESECLW